MKKTTSIRSAVIRSYLSSIFIILISIYFAVIIVFLNWENRRIQSEINKTVLSIQNELKVIPYLSDEDSERLISKEVNRFMYAQGDRPTLHLRIIFNGKNYTSDNITHFENYQNKVGEFQIVFEDYNVFILKNLSYKKDERKIYLQIYSNSKEIKNDLMSLLKSLFFTSLFIVFIAFILVKKIDSIIQSPIQEITKTANEINRYDLSKRIHIINKNNELGKLSGVINEMIDRLDISFKSQNKFISNASHELRTPLAVIKGYADLLDAGAKADPKILDHAIKEILTEVKNMELLLHNLLFLARKENETLENNIAPTKISDLIYELVEKQQLIDKEHEYKIIKNEPTTISIDGSLILQALRELLKNSSKYTPVGGIISVESYSKKNMHYIIISDTGKGISKENLKHVFDRFYIQDESRNRQKNSFGLGLSIVKDIIKVHRGDIYIESEINQGTKITITIPINHK